MQKTEYDQRDIEDLLEYLMQIQALVVVAGASFFALVMTRP